MVGGDTEPLTWFNFVYNRIIMEIEGTLIQKLAVQSGKSARGDWAKQDFVIEYQEGNFPTKACFNVWGADKVKELEQFQIGDKIKLSFNVSSREYNGKWYTDLRAWRISKAGAPAAGNYAQAPSGYQQSVPASYDMPKQVSLHPQRHSHLPRLRHSMTCRATTSRSSPCGVSA